MHPTALRSRRPAREDLIAAALPIIESNANCKSSRPTLIRSEATDCQSNLWVMLHEWRGGLPPIRWVALLPTRRVSMTYFGRRARRHAATHIRASNETICGSLRNLRPTLMAPDRGLRRRSFKAGRSCDGSNWCRRCCRRAHCRSCGAVHRHPGTQDQRRSLRVSQRREDPRARQSRERVVDEQVAVIESVIRALAR